MKNNNINEEDTIDMNNNTKALFLTNQKNTATKSLKRFYFNVLVKKAKSN